VPVNRAGFLLGRRVLAAAGVVLACLLAGPTAAAAESFTVNTSADEADASPGDFACLTAGGKCSLRAALEEANLSAGEFDEVGFDEEAFEEASDPPIALTSPLPPITDPLRLVGRQCETGAGVPGPCVEIDGLPGAPALTIEAEEVEIESLAVTGAEVGIEAVEAPLLRLRSSWLGVGIDGAAEGNGVGIRLGPGSDAARIGGEGPEAGNLVANSTGAGLEILGASEARVLGNDFGLDPAGAGAAPNGTAVAIASTPGFTATDNAIGTRVSPEAAATPACDGGCNLVSGSEASGIDLTGGNGSGPPVGTTIAGNHIGLDAAGMGTLANAGAGVLVGAASRTVVGGPRAGDANRIAGGAAGVSAGPGVAYLVVRGNVIGSNAASGSAEPPAAGIVVDAEGLSTPAEEASILDNELDLDGGAGIALQGPGGTIAGNRVRGAATGIRVHGEGQASLIEGNTVEATEGAGVLVENNANEIAGNVVSNAGGAGILIQGAPPWGVSGNVVGGDTAAEENAIVGSAGDAIEIFNAEESHNEVARNRGFGNAGLFISLVAAGPEPKGPNGGVLPPLFSAVSETGATGAADPGATVRLFRKATSLPGEIESFLGQATADEDGNWSVAFAAPLPPGTIVAATQTGVFGGTSELAIATTATGSGDSGEAIPPIVPPSPIVKRPRLLRAPQTKIVRKPKRASRDRTVRFTFTSRARGARFRCSLDGKRFRPCKSPQRYGPLAPGRHVFKVRAVDRLGNVDPTPAKWRFEILG
jgi:CSLREA domain-containing protein